MTIYQTSRLLKRLVIFPRCTAKSAFVTVVFILLFSQITLKMVDIILDQVEYPYNMYQGYPLTMGKENPYNINTNRTCYDGSKITTIIVIHSKVTYFKKRLLIRQSWANRHILSGYGMRVVFFVGLPLQKDLQTIINQESLDYNDIVQGKFYDSYTNITHKAVLWMRWIREYCPKAPFVLKLDDDVFVNLFSLYHDFLPNFKDISMKMWCEIKPAGKQPISRLRGKKWRVASHELVGLSYYPLTFCRGYFVIMTQDSIGPMYKAAKKTPFFWVDDYYVFGILANKTGVQHSPIVQFLSKEEEALKCLKSRTKSCPLLGVLLDTPDMMEILWRETVNHVNTDFTL